jgi:CheY-like chemotaxis protein
MTYKNKILIVDDEPINVELLEAMLPEEKHDIIRAYNGLEAVEKAINLLPDIILLDIMMPEMNGYQVTRKLKNDPLTHHIPIVLVTALNGVKDKVKGLEVGADDFLSKPLDRTELTARVNSLLKVKAYHDHLLNYQKELEVEVARRTEKLAAELVKRKETEAQLIQTQKMEAIGTLAGGIAHDFNNILASIMGYAELAILDVRKNTKLHEYLKEVMVAGSRAKDLVRQILTFSRQTEKELRPLRLEFILNEILKLLRASLPATIEMRQNINSESPVLADSTQIHQLIMNLCTNAAHAMEQKGGILTVELNDVQLETELIQSPSNIASGAYIKLTVSDTGHGMTPAVMERIFDPFFTTKEKGKGTGIGLSTVHGIVKSHGGEITVSTEPGKGSTFNVFLPRIEKDLVEDDVIDETKPAGNEHILFVDDEQAIVDIGKKMLTRLGYEVEACTGGMEALELFKSHPEKFDLIVCDMTMPKMTGEKLALKLREIRPNIPIILCTGYDAKMSELTEKNIVNAFLLKPLTMKEIGSMIRKVLDKN